ncbi:MAG: YggS family pyridoxal phosphate-dependent enzyme, partial [Saprospiraceae bacterium]|nr:YggS family pyridoxal phosphate-dependent enzyme [Saprospiraceae bacterium]
DVKLVAVSKTKPTSDILNLYNQGQLIFGENRVQELVQKYEALPKDISWHMIGHLQKNKVKYIAPFVDLIHSVDNLKLANKIDQEADKNNRRISILLQIKIATEDSKTGYAFDELLEVIPELLALKNIDIHGVMGMGTFTNDEAITRSEFKRLIRYFTKLRNLHFKEDSKFSEISMGMSGDYKIAIEEGSTMVRIGSLLFGAR